MLTEEQIKNLKPGDPVFVRGEFKSVDSDGDFLINTGNCHRCYSPLSVSLPSEHGTSVPTPKQAPTRLLRKGDRIRFKTWHGFLPGDLENGAELLGKEATVYENQEEDEFCVHFLFDGEDPEEEWHATYLPFIELVTAVEELEPYSVSEATVQYLVKEDNKKVVAQFCKLFHPQRQSRRRSRARPPECRV